MTGYYDIHCHILPEVDDGADDMETTIKMLRQEYEDGVRVIYATPHYRIGMFEPPGEKVMQQYELVKKQAKQIGDGIEIYLGCEFHANMDMISMIDTKKGIRMGNSSCVLTEFSEKHGYGYIRERCYALLSHGCQPIIAHAERYPALNHDLEKFHSLVDMGAFIQVNADSILGKNGFHLKHVCRKMMKWNLIHFIGSDAHDVLKRKPLIGQCAEYLKKKMGQAYMEKILIENPRKFIEEGR